MHLSKTAFLEGMQCPLRLWRQFHGVPEVQPEEIEGISEEAEIFAAGAAEVERLAGLWLGAAGEHQQVQLDAGRLKGVADFLIPEGAGWRLIEVKASSGPKPIHFYDLAFQWILARRAGYDVTATEVLHLDKNYVRKESGLDLDHLLVRADVSAEVRELLAEVESKIEALLVVMDGDEPARLPGPPCKGNRDSKVEVRPSTCGHLKAGGLCRAGLPSAWLGDVPRVNAKRFWELTQRASRSVLDLHPDELDLLPASAGLMIQAWQSDGEVWIQDAARSGLEALEWPLAFMDFEFEPAVPVPPHSGMRPNQKLPFQWAVSVQQSPGGPLVQAPPFLHGSLDDPREPFIGSLLGALPPTGSVVVYHRPAEAGVLSLYDNWLEGVYAARCHAIAARLFDLLPVVRRCYSSPALNGSYSLKAVAPAMTGAGYEGMAVSSGLAAVAQWREFVGGDPQTHARLRPELLAYCGRDADLMSAILDSVGTAAGDPRF